MTSEQLAGNSGALLIYDIGRKDEFEEIMPSMKEEKGLFHTDNDRVEVPSFACDKDPVSALVRTFFSTGKKPKGDQNGDIPHKLPITKVGEDCTTEIKKKVEALEAELLKLRKENRKLERSLKENEKVAEFPIEKAAWEEQKRAEIKTFNLFKEEQIKRLQRTIGNHNAKISELQEEVKRYERMLQAQWDTIKTNRVSLKVTRDVAVRTSVDLNKRAVAPLENQDYNLAGDTGMCPGQRAVDRASENETDEDYGPINKPEPDKNITFGRKIGLRKAVSKISDKSYKVNTEDLYDKYKTIGPECLGEVSASLCTNMQLACIDEEVPTICHQINSQLENSFEGKENNCYLPACQGPRTMKNANAECIDGSVTHVTSPADKGAVARDDANYAEQEMGSPSIRGRKSFMFPDGTRMEVYHDGLTCTYFGNGDIKNTLIDKTIEYYYAEVDTWHITKSNGVEVFYFPNYQDDTLCRLDPRLRKINDKGMFQRTLGMDF